MVTSSVLQLALSFVGGILGAAIGAFPAFMLCGFSLIIGTIIQWITGDATFILNVTWGPVLGPHTAFAGGIAAAAFAARKGLLDSGRNILKPLWRRHSILVLTIGGLFGLLGFLLSLGLSLVPSVKGITWVNPIALSIVINGMLVRLLVGQSKLTGFLHPGQSLWVPCPEEDQMPWHMHPRKLMSIALVVSIPVVFIARFFPQASGFLFGLAAVSLVFLIRGYPIPVVLHIVLSAQLATTWTGSMLWGIVFGVLAAIVADLSSCLFLDRGNTHIDPAAFAISVTHTSFVCFFYLGFSEKSHLWAIPALLMLLWMGYHGLLRLKK